MNSKFQIAFTSVAFNNTYDDVYKFESRAEQESFFEVTRLFQNAPYVNILLSDFINMTITYKLVGQTIFDLEKYNYCILRETVTEEDVETYKYYYYFINSMTYDSGNQFVIRLECDVMQTYYLGCTFAPCVISRAHLDRWKSRVGNTVTFNNAPNSVMLIPDTATTFSKYSNGRTRLVLPKRFNDDPIIDWLNANVEAWVYIFLNRSDSGTGYTLRQYNVKLPDGSSATIELPYPAYDDGSGNYRSQERYFSTLCYPIYRKGVTNKIVVGVTVSNVTAYTTIDGFGEQYFNELNNDTSYYISKQISHIPPFYTFGGAGVEYDISGGNLIIKSDPTQGVDGRYTTELGPNFIITQVVDLQAHTYRGLLNPYLLWTQIGLVPEDFTAFKNTYNINEVVGVDFNPALNPKLQSNSFIELVVSNEAGATFTYDLQKMDNGELKFIYSEYVAPCGASRGYLRLASAIDDYGVYKAPAQSNLTGLTFTQDMNLNYVNNQLASYLANNRNWQTQIGAKLAQNTFNMIWGAFKNIATLLAGGKGGKAGGGQQNKALNQERVIGGGDVLSGAINMAFDLWNISLSMDNMRGAPDTMASANGIIMFNSTYSEIGLYLELFVCIDTEILREAQRMNVYGYSYGMLGNVKDFDNLRKYFNYVSASPTSITYYDGVEYVGLPTPILNQLKAVLNKGVRFWNVAKTGMFLNYTKENYELNLEN